MSLPLRKRAVHFYELQLRSYNHGVKNPSCVPLRDLLQCFAAMAKGKGQLPLTIRKSSQLHTVLADWHYDKVADCYELLICKANAALSDVALRDLGTARLRKAGKTKVEGIEVSAHALVRPNGDGRTAAMLLTMGAGVADKDVEVLLRLLSRQAAQLAQFKALFFFDHPSSAKDARGNAVQYKVNYGFAAFAHRGQTLDAALQSGEFEGMDLIAHEQSQFDAGGNLQVTERSLSIEARLPQAVTGAAVRNALRSFRQSPDGAIFDRLRIRYKTPSGRHTSAVLALNDLDAAFTLKEHIEFDSDVEAQQEKLCPIILKGMKPLLQLVPV